MADGIDLGALERTTIEFAAVDQLIGRAVRCFGVSTRKPSSSKLSLLVGRSAGSASIRFYLGGAYPGLTEVDGSCDRAAAGRQILIEAGARSKENPNVQASSLCAHLVLYDRLLEALFGAAESDRSEQVTRATSRSPEHAGTSAPNPSAEPRYLSPKHAWSHAYGRPEFPGLAELAANRLREAADLIRSDAPAARAVWAEIDGDALHDVYRDISYTQWYAQHPGAASDAPIWMRLANRPASGAKQRGATVASGVKRLVLQRDGNRCRYCGVPLTTNAEAEQLVRAFPELRGPLYIREDGAVGGSTKKGWPSERESARWWLSGPAFDHVEPASSGGSGNDVANVVLACQCCNTLKYVWTLEELGVIDPRR